MQETDDALAAEYDRTAYAAYRARLDAMPAPLNHQQQAALLMAYKAGNSAAYRQLWTEATRLVPFVMNKLIRARTPLAYDDMDAQQEANLAIGKALERWDPEKGSLSTWLIPHIRGTLLNYLNSKRNVEDAPDLPEDAYEGTTDEDTSTGVDALTYEEDSGLSSAERDQFRDWYTEHIKRMPRNIRFAMGRHYVHGDTVVCIAHRLGQSTETVRRYLRAGEEELRAYAHAKGVCGVC